jgi:hypothetical protein
MLRINNNNNNNNNNNKIKYNTSVLDLLLVIWENKPHENREINAKINLS